MTLTVFAYEVETNESPAHGFGTSLEAVVAELHIIRREMAFADQKAPKPSGVYSFDLVAVELEDLDGVGGYNEPVREFALTNKRLVKLVA